MRAIDPRLAVRIASEATTLALCWRVVRADGVALGFTTHDRALMLGGLAYRPAPGLKPSAIEASGGEDGHAMDVAGALSDAALSEVDLERGRYVGADVTTFLVDWEQPEAGTLELASGRIGDVEARDGEFVAELRTPLAELRATPIELYSPECRARLGDRRCRVDLSRHTSMTTVQAVEGTLTLVMAAPLGAGDALRYGRLRVLTGAAAGEEREITESVDTRASIDDPIAGLGQGARIEVRAGCDKRFATCRDRFTNTLNFRGEPHVPGADAAFRYAGI